MPAPLTTKGLDSASLEAAAFEFVRAHAGDLASVQLSESLFSGDFNIRVSVNGNLHTFSGTSRITALRRLVECLPDQLAQRQAVELVSGIFSKPAR